VATDNNPPNEDPPADDDNPTIDPAAIIKSAVEDAMDGWWKKNRPAPNRTSQPEDNGLMATLFGKGYRR
jgi:hypothetical protein